MFHRLASDQIIYGYVEGRCIAYVCQIIKLFDFLLQLCI